VSEPVLPPPPGAPSGAPTRPPDKFSEPSRKTDLAVLALIVVAVAGFCIIVGLNWMQQQQPSPVQQPSVQQTAQQTPQGLAEPAGNCDADGGLDPAGPSMQVKYPGFDHTTYFCADGNWYVIDNKTGQQVIPDGH